MKGIAIVYSRHAMECTFSLEWGMLDEHIAQKTPNITWRWKKTAIHLFVVI